jgi:ABC-2 type transport system permease protein
MKPVLSLASVITKRFLRDKTALFFTFLFPLIFLVVFGFIFKGGNGANFNVAIFNYSDSELAQTFIESAKNTGVLTVKDISEEELAKQKISRSEIDAYLVIPETFGSPDANGMPNGTILLRYSEGNEQTGQALNAFLGSIVLNINNTISPYTPPLTITNEPQNINNVSRFDYVLAGLLGFSLMSLGIFGVVNGFVSDKKTGAIARLRVTPLKAWQLIVATALNKVIVAFMSVIMMLIVSATIFGFTMKGDWFSFIFVTILSALCMFGIGLGLGGWARSEEQAAPLANLVTFPMMFLSGVFFPVFIMPQFLQTISKFIPLTPIVDSFRLILTEGSTLVDLGPQLAIISAWTILAYVIAGKVFRWE